MTFTHLHVHSNFSFLDAGSSVGSLADRAKALGCDCLALTDHNGLYGAVRFYSHARRIGIKPIIGVEIDLESGHHLVLLAKNLGGYSNLCRIITRAQLSHEKGHAAANLELIEQYKDDLFCLSGCLRGEVASLAALGDMESAKAAAKKSLAYLRAGPFLHRASKPHATGTALLNSRLHCLALELGPRCVATNNVHYAENGISKSRTCWPAFRQPRPSKKIIRFARKTRSITSDLPKAMAELFSRYPDAVAATDWVAGQCNLDLGLGAYRFPDFPCPRVRPPTAICAGFASMRWQSSTDRSRRELSSDSNMSFR